MNILSTCEFKEKEKDRLYEALPSYFFHHYPTPQQVSTAELASMDAWITYGNDMPIPVLATMPNLRWIHVMQSGVNNLPFEELANRGIRVTNAKGINSGAIAEYLMSMMLNLTRKTFVFYEAQKRMEWDTKTRLDELGGKTVGIIGFGHIGKELAKRAKAFDMNVLAIKRNLMGEEPNVDHFYRTEEKHELLAKSDFVTILLPLTKETRDYISTAELATMKSSAYLLHISRGEVIDQGELIRSLKERTIAGAVLDVFPQEPLLNGHPYWTMDNVLVTPHIAGDHFPGYMSRAMELLIKNLHLFQEDSDRMCNFVNLDNQY